MIDWRLVAKKYRCLKNRVTQPPEISREQVNRMSLYLYVDGVVQDRGMSSVNALGLP